MEPAAASATQDADCIEFWRSDELDDAFYTAGAFGLSPEDVAEIDALRNPVLRDRATRCRILLRYALSHRVGQTIEPGCWRFSRSQSGRLRADGKFSELDFSISHSGTISSIAVARGRIVGIDLEVESDAINPLEMGDYIHPIEARALRMLHPAQRRSSFFRLWTLKEAYSKFLGTGLATDFASIAFAFDNPSLIETPIEDGDFDRAQFSAWRMTHGADIHHIALALGERLA
jgi:phosphopantetheinyl transferase